MTLELFTFGRGIIWYITYCFNSTQQGISLAVGMASRLFRQPEVNAMEVFIYTEQPISLGLPLLSSSSQPCETLFCGRVSRLTAT